MPAFAQAVHVHAVQGGAQPAQRGAYKGGGAVRAVLHALELGVQDEDGGGGDEQGDHGPVEALLEGVVVEADVDCADEAGQDEGEDAGEVEEEA